MTGPGVSTPPQGPSEANSATQAERGIATVAAAVRSVVAVQILLGATTGTALARFPALYVALCAAVGAVALLLVTQCLLTGSVRNGWWRIPDLVLAWVAPPALYWLLPAEYVTGTWEVWYTACAINVAALAATWLRLGTAAAHAVALGAWCLLFTLMAAPNTWQGSLTDALTIPGYALVFGLIIRYVRGLASAADEARERAVAATRALELQRYRLTVHDATSILRLLSDDRTPHDVLPGLRAQANREAMRLRHYLDPAVPVGLPDTRRHRTVGTMLAVALEGFDDLPLDLALDLGAEAPLSETVWHSACGAVTTVLHNVRLHAHAGRVVVHADTDGEQWEVVVCDDGVGFNPAPQTYGFGLSHQVHEALESCGATATIDSAPGRGTSVTLTGPVHVGQVQR